MINGHLLGSMQVFISVAESGSFSESARRLGVSQPSISRQVSALEESLGVRLLHRTTRRLSLTEAGQFYYERARQIFQDVVDAGQALSGFKETPSGVLRISAPYTWADEKITPHLAEFLKRYPKIKMNIECNDTFQDMIQDQLDLVIRVGVLKDSSFIAVPFGDVKMIVCATPGYLEQNGTPRTAQDLQNHNFIMFEDYNQILVNDNVGIHQLTLKGNISSNTVTVMLSAIRQHIGFSVLPDLLVNKLLETGELIDLMPTVDIGIKNLPINQVFALYSNRKHLPAKVRAFLDYFKPRFI